MTNTTSPLRKKTAKSNAVVKRIAKNSAKTKRIARSEESENGNDAYLSGWSRREEESFMRSSGIYDSYSSMKGFDSWD
jgi:hypothetical protein